jgi:N-acetylglucosaminylphosphatidylinositol deacetylase
VREAMATALTIIVTAHPDDESMFFLPTICAMQKTSKIWLLCLTSGNFDGIGAIRRQELEAVANMLKLDKLLIVDDEVLPDHMQERWNVDLAEKIISDTLRTNESKQTIDDSNSPHSITFVTFDSLGVSGHVNHIDTFRAVRQFCETSNYPLWSLKSVRSPLVKYVPVCEWLALVLFWIRCLFHLFGWLDPPPASTATTSSRDKTVTYHLFDPRCNWRCMALHKSQFVWYRRLFVIFSCYTYVNRLERVTTSHTAKKII